MKRNPRVLTGPHGLIRSIGAHRTLVATARLQFLALLRDGIVKVLNIQLGVPPLFPVVCVGHPPLVLLKGAVGRTAGRDESYSLGHPRPKRQLLWLGRMKADRRGVGFFFGSSRRVLPIICGHYLVAREASVVSLEIIEIIEEENSWNPDNI